MNNTINRLIIIGNGFDLAHGMKTKYKDFVNGYLRQRIESFDEKDSEDLLIKIKYKYKEDAKKQSHRLLKDYRQYLKLKELNIESRVDGSLQPEEIMLLNILYGKLHPQEQNEEKNEFTEEEVQEILNDCTEEEENEIHLTQGIIQLIEKQGEYSVKYSPFFKKVYDTIENKNWVDIEYAYYEYLCDICNKPEFSKEEVSKEIDELNEEMKFITKKLVEYLKGEDGGFVENYIRIGEDKLCKKIRHKMMMPLSKQEIAYKSLKQWDSFVEEKYSIVRKEDDAETFSQYKQDNGELNIEWLMEEQYPEELRPDEILILNFNYTSLAAAYHARITDDLKYKTNKGTAYLNQIHGSLDGKEEIIFGYGNTQDENFPKLKQNDKFLENIKPMRYRTSFLYPHVVKFIGDAPFQVCIMGHSCGESDRTLLRDIFQHENCVSIKPYYWEQSKDKNNYKEIYNNICRCFDDDGLIGTKIVCKDYCKPLLQPAEEKI